MLFSLPVLPVDSVGAASLNQTFGWGCESGDAYGSGTSFDGDGVGTNQPDTDVWSVYSAKGAHPHGTAAGSHQQLFDTTYTDSQGTVYDGNSGWWVTDSYSCNSDDCGGIGGYGTTSSAQTGGTTQLVEHDANGLAITGDIKSSEVFDFSGDAGDVTVPVDQIQPAMYTALAGQDTCAFTCDPSSASCGGFSEPLGTGACNGVSITQGPAAMDTACVGSTCVEAAPGSIELQYANAVPIAAAPVEQKPSPCTGVRPTPAHLVLTAHALTFGALSATWKLTGWTSEDSKGWSADFKADSTEAASTITPIGGYVLKTAFEEAA